MALPVLAVATLGISLLEKGLSLYGKSQQLKEKAMEVKIRDAYNQSLYDLNETAIKASFARNVRANQMSEGIALGRQASYLSKSRIGTAGTQVQAFQAIMQRTDFDNQGFELQRMTQLGKLGVSRHASTKGVQTASQAGLTWADWAGAGVGVGSDFIKAKSIMNKEV